MLTILRYNGNFDGFLAAIFDVYDLKLQDAIIRREDGEEVANLFAQEIYSSYDEKKAERVQLRLQKILGKRGLRELWMSFLGEEKGIEDTLLSVIRYALKTQKNVLGDYGHPDVLHLRDTLKKIGRESHRMKAFVRFKLGDDGIYYSLIEPDFDVLPLLEYHFKTRFADQRWLIYDLKRKYGIYYDLKEVQIVNISESESKNGLALREIRFDDDELHFQRLWKSYFTHTTIESRLNKKLHLQLLPRRYWKYLSEKNPLL
ncbi:putative DNA metabolism protein [Balneicella halophila]|uniref:Putative DNA metabolism protein n=1 Tax=Balneicella halophila TaxID=1537566 RepID=A0A7L4UPN6_BALHA|nr:TIGR03915 family putative DNA repair protein [Balneicella halophila]PVX51078.1 putative DNA metabolism protein [Balneicella halophila]